MATKKDRLFPTLLNYPFCGHLIIIDRWWEFNGFNLVILEYQYNLSVLKSF